MSGPGANIAEALRAMAQAAPERVAMQLPDGKTRFRALTYRELDTHVDALAAGFARVGILRGTRVALMVRPGEALFATMFALFRAGAVPVLIDPGIDRRALRACLDEAAPEAFIGIPLAHVARIVLRWASASVRTLVTVGPRLFWGGHTLKQVRALGEATIAGRARTARKADTTTTEPLRGDGDIAMAVAAAPDDGTRLDDLAAILFTSGSTGVPKGVEYTHANFIAQVTMIRDAFGIAPGEIDLPTFPPFALFDPGLGMTSVIPRMDPTRPAQADPRELLDTIARHGCTTMFGSPALLDTLSRYAPTHNAKSPTLRRVLSAGAPVRPDVVERMYALLPPDAQLWTPYGATECLPVAIIEGREILSHARALTDTGAGICVGRPVAPNRVRIIATSDDAIATWREARELPAGEIGEITVAGPTVTRAYFRRDEATRLAKIDDDGTIVHRMGDLGYFDADGRLWYVGRKSHRVVTHDRTLYTEQVEGIFNTVPGVRRSALVGIPHGAYQAPVVLVEIPGMLGAQAWLALHGQLLARASQFAVTRGIDGFLRTQRFPVDIRHNAKIGREKLARLADTILNR